MALTPFQRSVCRLIADSRKASGESYVAGAAALNELIRAPRVSHDVDLFHDTEAALDASWRADRALLVQSGLTVRTVRERPSFVEAEVVGQTETLLLQWVRDSAYRFFPLLEHTEFGLVLHPFDLATNKTLALVGRLEVRDWVDIIECHARIQASGFGPAAIVEHAGRTGRYSAEDVASLSFAGAVPDAAQLATRWHTMLREAREIVAVLPPEQSGKCVLDRDGKLFAGGIHALREALAVGSIAFHSGRIRGALPQIAAS